MSDDGVSRQVPTPSDCAAYTGRLCGLLLRLSDNYILYVKWAAEHGLVLVRISIPGYQY